jgi:hypothetical protein
VCTTSHETKGIRRLRSYTLPDELDIPATICEATLATSAAPTFFDIARIGARKFTDGALGANNPVDEVEDEASNIWCSKMADLRRQVKCFISIGTGHPGKKAIEDKMIKFLSKTLADLAAETERTAEKFVLRWRYHYDKSRYFRFNVQQGLQDVGLAEYQEQGLIEEATEEYLMQQEQRSRMRDCVSNLKHKKSILVSPARMPFQHEAEGGYVSLYTYILVGLLTLTSGLRWKSQGRQMACRMRSQMGCTLKIGGKG